MTNPFDIQIIGGGLAGSDQVADPSDRRQRNAKWHHEGHRCQRDRHRVGPEGRRSEPARQQRGELKRPHLEPELGGDRPPVAHDRPEALERQRPPVEAVEELTLAGIPAHPQQQLEQRCDLGPSLISPDNCRRVSRSWSARTSRRNNVAGTVSQRPRPRQSTHL